MQTWVPILLEKYCYTYLEMKVTLGFNFVTLTKTQADYRINTVGTKCPNCMAPGDHRSYRFLGYIGILLQLWSTDAMCSRLRADNTSTSTMWLWPYGHLTFRKSFSPQLKRNASKPLSLSLYLSVSPHNQSINSATSYMPSICNITNLRNTNMVDERIRHPIYP